MTDDEPICGCGDSLDTTEARACGACIDCAQRVLGRANATIADLRAEHEALQVLYAEVFACGVAQEEKLATAEAERREALATLETVTGTIVETVTRWREYSEKIELKLAIMAFIAQHDLHGDFWWRCDGEHAPVTFFVNCNDLFAWASADCERFDIGDIPALEKAIQDAGEIHGIALWCCRKRGMRPQRPVYLQELKDPALSAMFDACGPERDPASEG